MLLLRQISQEIPTWAAFRAGAILEVRVPACILLCYCHSRVFLQDEWQKYISLILLSYISQEIPTLVASSMYFKTHVGIRSIEWQKIPK